MMNYYYSHSNNIDGAGGNHRTTRRSNTSTSPTATSSNAKTVTMIGTTINNDDEDDDDGQSYHPHPSFYMMYEKDRNLIGNNNNTANSCCPLCGLRILPSNMSNVSTTTMKGFSRLTISDHHKGNKDNDAIPHSAKKLLLRQDDDDDDNICTAYRDHKIGRCGVKGTSRRGRTAVDFEDDGEYDEMTRMLGGQQRQRSSTLAISTATATTMNGTTDSSSSVLVQNLIKLGACWACIQAYSSNHAAAAAAAAAAKASDEDDGKRGRHHPRRPVSLSLSDLDYCHDEDDHHRVYRDTVGSSMIHQHGIISHGHDGIEFQHFMLDDNKDNNKQTRKDESYYEQYYCSDYKDDVVVDGDDAGGTPVVYIGDYNLRGQRHGPHGELIWDNGDRYVGSFVNGKREGQGTLFFHDGSAYTGDWLGNQRHGSGQRTFSNGDIYVGQYRFGQRWGGPHCKLKFANGDLYVGHWEANHFHGPGRYFFADGTAFEGVFVHGMKQGKFKRQRPNGELDILRFENDQVVGQGVRWNENRTKTWLLRMSPTRNSNHHRNPHRRHDVSTGGGGAISRRPQNQRQGSLPNLKMIGGSNRSITYTVSTSLYPPEPPCPTQEQLIAAKKSARIPIAEAVSIGYDCELGESLRDTNPAFWTIGNIASNMTTRTGEDISDNNNNNVV